MVIRTSISITTPQIEKAIKDVAKLHYRNNASSYLESLVIEDLVNNRGYDRLELLDEKVGEEKAN